MVTALRAAAPLACALLASCFSDPMLGATTGAPGSSTAAETSATAASTSSATGPTTDLAVCGDGSVDGDEQCDDGNDVPDDQCTNNCRLPSCGDGVVSPGEQCDDGNLVDNDACNHLCAASTCGDGIVDPGEQCDDGNMTNIDACVGCLRARCGDALVQAGIEACDDGNLDPFDACSATCQLNTCGNQDLDPDETGVDCGGPCGACCNGDADCGENTLCFAGACRLPSTCQELQGKFPGLASGDFALDPDGPGPLVPLTARCEVVPDQCAYTLVRIDDPSLGMTQPAYVAACAALGWEVVVTRTAEHAEALFNWNGEPANLLNVFPNYAKAMGLKNWSAICRNTPCPYFVTANPNGDAGCMVSFEPSGDSYPGDRLERRLAGCGFEGNWNDFGPNVEIQGWVICSPNDC